MTGYASNTGTRRNLAALREAGWRLLLTPENPRMREGLAYGIDNGAWGAFKNSTPFDEARFLSLIDAAGAQADFIVVPDIVAGGYASLEFTLSWLPRLERFPRLLIAVQDGMAYQGIANLLSVRPGLGIFLGGSTEWKLATIREWGRVAASGGWYYHVGRVNSARRVRLCAEAGAHSFDGTSCSRYACTLPLLDVTARQPSLWSPRYQNGGQVASGDYKGVGE